MKSIDFRKIRLIFNREYVIHVRKKSFFWMTILGPVLFGFISILPIWLASQNDVSKVIIVDKTVNQQAVSLFKNTNSSQFTFLENLQTSPDSVIKNSDFDVIITISDSILAKNAPLVCITKKRMNWQTRQLIETKLDVYANKTLLNNHKIDSTEAQKIITPIYISEKFITESSNNSEIATTIGLVGAVLIYFFIFMYGIQIMRGVLEEKTSRVVEIIITSVKPIELMAGKILGMAAVGLTQFLIWIILTTSISFAISARFKTERFSDENISQTISKLKTSDIDKALEMNKIVGSFSKIDFPKIAFSFVFFFLFGYLLYAAMFAAIGAAVDNDADTQQFMFPVTVPLLVSFVFAQYITTDPTGSLAQWLCFIPLTSPVIVMVLIPFGLSWQKIILSGVILIVTVILITYLASKIYKTGLLMYGKKPTFREFAKWMFR